MIVPIWEAAGRFMFASKSCGCQLKDSDGSLRPSVVKRPYPPAIRLMYHCRVSGGVMPRIVYIPHYSANFKALIALLLLCGASGFTQELATIHSFQTSEGILPFAGVVQGLDGSLYGTTLGGGNFNGGTAFRLTPAGRFSDYGFCEKTGCTDGDSLQGSLTQSMDGTFWGTTTGGGANGNYGTIFRITKGGVLTTLYSFCAQVNCKDGSAPTSPPIEGTDGNFYGTTYEGGYGNRGTIYKITPTGQFSTIYTFCHDYYCTDGDAPYGAMIQGGDGNLYGTTAGGGANNGFGTVFKVTQSGNLTVLYSFCSRQGCADGWRPYDPLVLGTDGNFYGVTQWGGNSDYNGTLFEITPSGVLTTLYNFCSQTNCADGSQPYGGLSQGTDGSFYGTTATGGLYGEGTVFRLSQGGSLTSLYSFCAQSGCEDGAIPQGDVIQATNGKFYGTTTAGGNNPVCGEGCGTIFSVDSGLAPFVAFISPTGKVGQTGGILGQGFTGTTAVTLNGTPASFTVVSDTFIKATVPAGATTGYVTVATPTGTLTSNVPFHVIP
jgi:uncharacterized repeat protein (TIGR03803 family)